MKIKILTVSVLLSITNAMTLVPSYQSSTTKATGQVSGTVVDMNEGRVSSATVTIEGEGLTRSIITAADGTYKIELPVGTYRIKAARTGFCPSRRAAFRALSSSVILNFTLIPCSIVNEITIKNDQYIGEADSYRDPFKEEVFPLVPPKGPSLELLVRYSLRHADQNIVEYRGTLVPYEEHADTPTGSVHREKYLGVTVSYDFLMIHADRVRLDTSTFHLEAEGNVVVENGKQRIYAKRTEVDFKSGEPLIKTMP